MDPELCSRLHRVFFVVIPKGKKAHVKDIGVYVLGFSLNSLCFLQQFDGLIFPPRVHVQETQLQQSVRNQIMIELQLLFTVEMHRNITDTIRQHAPILQCTSVRHWPAVNLIEAFFCGLHVALVLQTQSLQKQDYTPVVHRELILCTNRMDILDVWYCTSSRIHEDGECWLPGVASRVRSASKRVSIMLCVSSGRLLIMEKPFHMYIISWKSNEMLLEIVFCVCVCFLSLMINAA